MLDLAVPELNRDCPFCRLIASSIESVVDKDWWNGRKINSEDRNENENDKDGSVMLIVSKDSPIIGFFYYGGSLEVKFMIYSSDEVCSSPKPSGNLTLKLKW